MVEKDKSNELYWIIDHEELSWAPGKFIKDAGNEIHVQCIDDGQYYSIEKPAIEVHPSCLEGVPDLLSLGEFNEGALLHTIRTRHGRKQIYTSIGTPILLSVNPYQKLKIFTTFIARKYRQYSNAVRGGAAPAEKPEPHLFMVAEDSYQDMFSYNKNQSIIISGESGAGKTEATKIVLKYLAQANTNFSSAQDIDMLDVKNYMVADNSIEKQVLDSNPLLEAFGNAKTFKNNNSSRFGKFIQVNFEPSGKIHSATIINYLLEKSRIVFQQGVERNFHIFYQLMSSPEYKAKYKLGSIESYHYLNQSGVYKVDGIDDREDFDIMLQCMKNIGFSQMEIQQIMNIVVAILLFGNVEFDKVAKSGVGDIAQINAESNALVTQIASLLQLTPQLLIKCLTTKIQVIGKDTIESNLNQDESYNSRDAMAKMIYGKLFNWLVERINLSISQKMNVKNSKNLKFIGLLDIFGFEIFKQNSFEQLCINYANEKLQQHFNQHMFTMEQIEYKSENIQWSQIQFIDNQVCIDLIECIKQQPSLFKLLDEECMIKGTDAKLLKKYNDVLSSNKHYKRPNKFGSTEFIVKHYAGEVSYDINGFIEKNRDTINDVVSNILSQSQSQILSKLFWKEPEQQPQQQKQGAFGQVKVQAGGGLKGNSLSNQFRTQLHELMHILKESSPRYIRCIKPNSRFSPTEFDSNDVHNQLKCAGMLEAIRIRKAGYAIRVTQEDFGKRYRAIIGKKKFNQLMQSNGGNAYKQLCEAIFKEVLTYQQYKKTLDPVQKKWQIGVSKVFMKEDAKIALESAMGNAVLQQSRHIQRLWRGFKARKLYRQMVKSDKLIKKHIRKYVIRRRFRRIIVLFVRRMKAKIIKIQKTIKRRHRSKMIVKEINRRIHKKKMEEERKRQEEEKRKRIQEEIEMKRRMQEEKENQRKKMADEELQRKNNSQQSDDYERQAFVKQSQNSEISLGNESSFNESGPSNVTNSFSQNDQQKGKTLYRQQTQEPFDQQSFKANSQNKARFGQNIQKLEQFLTHDSFDQEQFQDMQKTLKEKVQENDILKAQNLKLKMEMDEKDKKIKELNIRLETQRKQSSNKASKELENMLNNQDISKIGGGMEMSFTTIDERISMGHSAFGMTSGLKQGTNMALSSDILQEKEKLLEQREEELQQVQNKVDLLQSELQSKDSLLDQLKEENEQLQEKNKKWLQKLNQEIEKNNSQVSNLTKQIKELQEKNYKLEFEIKEKQLTFDKKAFKDQSDELKRLEQSLREKQDIIDDLEMQKFNQQEWFVKEQSSISAKYEDVQRELNDITEKFALLQQSKDAVEEQLYEKDEICKKQEMDIEDLANNIKVLHQQLEMVGDSQSNYNDTMEQEKLQLIQATQRSKELQRELDKLKSMDNLKQAEIDRFKVQCEKQKKKIKDIEDENDDLHEKTHELKAQMGELERQLLYKDGSGNETQELEKQKLISKIEDLQTKLIKKKNKCKELNIENDFYNQTTTLFLTIKKIIENEKKYCYMLTSESDTMQKTKIMNAIVKCQQISSDLDQKLKKILINVKKQQQKQE